MLTEFAGWPVTKWLALAAGFALILLAAAVAYAGRERTGTVAKVFNGKSLVLEGGQVVRLASLQAPNAKDNPKRAIQRGAEPLAEEATVRLMQLVLKQKVRLVIGAQAKDRKGRLVAQAYLADGTWVQGEMLKAGLAMVYGFPDQRDKLKEMLAAEAEARTKKRGLWALPYYRVLPAEEAAEGLERFRLVEGRVRRVSESGDRTYLNFGEDYRKDFTATIAPSQRKLFKGMDLAALTGRQVRVRGWLYERGGPMVELTCPEQLELVGKQLLSIRLTSNRVVNDFLRHFAAD